MSVIASMKLALVIGVVVALLMGDLRGLIFTAPIAVFVVSAACLLRELFFTPIAPRS